MRIVQGDLWDFHAEGWKIVISTNIGWTETPPAWARSVGAGHWPHHNNMGAGVALEAARRWPWLPEWLGSHYRARHRVGLEQRPVEHDQLRLIFVPVKPLLPNDPAYSWNQNADLELIRRQLGMLSAHQGRLALGFIGCGNGNARQRDVLPSLLSLEMVRAHKGHGETIVVDRVIETGLVKKEQG